MEPFYAVDPSETREADFCLLAAKATLAKAKAEIVNSKSAEAPALIEKAEAEFRSYVPGTGPLFTIGHIEESHWIEIEGRSIALSKLEPASPEANRLWKESSRDVVRWGVRGHKNLRTRDGKDLPFETVEVEFLGQKRRVVAETTLEAYAASRILRDLADIVTRAQLLGDDLGNG